MLIDTHHGENGFPVDSWEATQEIAFYTTLAPEDTIEFKITSR